MPDNQVSPSRGLVPRFAERRARAVTRPTAAVAD
jgi:hypothetical protein